MTSTPETEEKKVPPLPPIQINIPAPKLPFSLPMMAFDDARRLERVVGDGPVVTLQNVVLELQGVCTEPDVFYKIEGDGWIAGAEQTVHLGPSAVLGLEGFGNMLGIGTWHQASVLNGLYLAVKGRGQVEIRVYQGKTGCLPERLASQVCLLSPDVETVLDLSHFTLNGAVGGIWFELRNSSAETSAQLTAARYLTKGAVPAGMRLALCMAATDTVQRAEVERQIAAWCAGPGAAAGAQLLVGAAGAMALEQLQAAKAQGFTHAVVMDPTTVVSPEVLTRLMAGLALARNSGVALGAATLDSAEKWFVASNGVTVDREAKPAPLYPGQDLREREQVISMECELAEQDGPDLLFLPEFLAVSLSRISPDDRAMTPGDFDEYLRLNDLRLYQVMGVIVAREASAESAMGPMVTLQNLIYPEAGLCTEVAMFYHADGPMQFSDANNVLSIEPETVVKFDSYFNALNIGKWHANCRPEGLYLALRGRGRVLVKVYHAVPDRSWELLCDAPYTMSAAKETVINLSHYAKTAVTGVIYFQIEAISSGVQLMGARYAVPGAINPAVKLCLSITTFKREAEVENTARRMALYFETADFADQMHLNIVDNGDSARIIESDKITRIPNANLGGAGGFTRGLIEAQKMGYSHVLFMDDDASIPMEALHRAYAFLSLSKDPKAAVSGAMISNSDKWRMWENGAIFDRHCRPQFNGTDLRDWHQVMTMEFQSAAARSSKMYGGWWFFAFPVAEVERYPFPFFVRGDDINFSLANDFHITTLNGVVSFAEDFSDKESPMTLYLDLRNHFVQHLTLEKMEIGPLAMARIGLGFFLRNAVKFQYETIDALFMAWRDVLKGPEFFAENADAAAQRAAIKAIYKRELWKPIGEMNLSERYRFRANRGFRRELFRYTLNGHFLPFYNLWANKRVMPPRDRNNYDEAWGSCRITYTNSTRDKAYTVQQSKLKFLARVLVFFWLTARLTWGYKALLAKYRKGYLEITVPSFWQRVLKLAKPAPDAAVDMVKPAE